MTRRLVVLLTLGLAFAIACPFDVSLREYLGAHFWQPFAKVAGSFERKNVRRASAPFAGMARSDAGTPLGKLRTAYSGTSWPAAAGFDFAPLRQAVAAARAGSSLSAREREEVDLIGAKIDMRAAEPDNREQLLAAREKIEAFLRTARTPEFLSEARGWVAHIHYMMGEQSEAGKIYLDELNRDGSNLSRETVLSSLNMTYGYDGHGKLIANLDQYFDTPEHAVFAIEIATNPARSASFPALAVERRMQPSVQPYLKVKALLEQHAALLKSGQGTGALALLSMRTALRAGDPPEAIKIAEMVPSADAVRGEPDFQWMLAAAHFLSRDFPAAEAPLLNLFQSRRAEPAQKAAAAYALCGVYEKTRNTVEQLRFALWLRDNGGTGSVPPDIADLSIYWAVSGWDSSLLLDTEASGESLEAFAMKYPESPSVRLVKYALAVRRAREDRYEDAADLYGSSGAPVRAGRMQHLASLYKEANRSDVSAAEVLEAKFKLAQYIGDNPDRLYFNDTLWGGLQRYALFADKDDRLTREEHERLVAGERKLKDGQEERWRAYLILKDVVRDAGKTDLGRRAARLALKCLRGIRTDRFGREEEIRDADTELSEWLRN